MALRVATYNIHRCIGRDGLENPHRTAAVLQALDADLIVLQEVAYEPKSPGDTLKFLAEAVEAESIPGPTLQEGKGRYGNAMLSKLKPRGVQRIDISLPNREPRGVLQLMVEASAKTISILGTHLGLSKEERRYQMNRIGGLLKRQAADVVILMGDFNVWYPWGRSLRELNRLFAPAFAPSTFPSRRPLLALDRIWVRPAHVLKRATVFNNPLARMASDHLPLIADLDMT